MARRPVKPNTLRAIFAKSGNMCAYPGCTHELVNAKNQFVAEICHIESAEPGGERYNPVQTDEQRRSFENLLALCHKHHVETNDVVDYPAERMKVIKANHEAANGKKAFKVDESVIFQIESEMLKYWASVQKANKEDHIVPDLAVEIGSYVSPVDLFAALYEAASSLEKYTDMLREWDYALSEEIRVYLEKIGYSLAAYDAEAGNSNPFSSRAWEIHHLGMPNRFTDLRVLMLQIEVRFLEEYLKTHANDGRANIRFDAVKAELLEAATSAGYAD